MNKYYKFGLLTAVILGTLGWLAVGGINETKSYYKTIEEVSALNPDSADQRLRVGGDVVENSIVRNGHDVHFTLVQAEGDKKLTLKVVYSGIDPLPDTFKDGAQALADGKLGSDGVFRATKIQAKCASKYEAAPGAVNPATRS
jgi:cytochrome c-type biogenesis protein CcmE